ncbi:hypothetical protein [Glaciecola sp. KUL10]|jgi:hypothetical protein|nr:hypothetical protein [Glaciecola sp. KUL10]GBL04245.1 hypothetical protein KUL10_15510 [Glaciecola sp. KUL10]
MIDNFVFLIVFVLLPYLCWQAMKLDDKEQKGKEKHQGKTTSRVEK